MIQSKFRGDQARKYTRRKEVEVLGEMYICAMFVQAPKQPIQKGECSCSPCVYGWH